MSLKVPRASLSIALLNDEDYRLLMSSKGGVEAFGVFIAVVLVGRERLQQGKAHQVPGSESLIIKSSTTHVRALAHLSQKQLGDALALIASVTAETDSQPWMFINDDDHLVVRSFFKFNASASWGGNREGAGRPSKRNQLDSLEINLIPNKESSWVLSDSDSDSDSNSPLTPPHGGGTSKPPTRHQKRVPRNPTPAEIEARLNGATESHSHD